MAPSEVSEISSRRMVVHSDGQRIKVEYVLRGDPTTQPVVLFVSGLGSQLIEWPEEMVTAVEAEGYCTLRYDNRCELPPLGCDFSPQFCEFQW